MEKRSTNQTLSSGKRRSQLKVLDEAARQVLAGMFGQHRMSDRILAAFFREHRSCGSRDRALISESIYAMLRYWGFLRKYLPAERRSELEQGSIRLTSQELAALLAAGCFIAGNAENCELIRQTGQLPPLPQPASSPERRARQLLDYFHITGCQTANADLLPQWISDALPDSIDREKFLNILSLRPPMWLRMQCSSAEEKFAVLGDLAAAGAEVTPHALMPDAVMVRAKINLFSLESYRNGKFEIQDLASQCVGAACGAKSGERWLDACAGAGGKTLQLAAMMNRKGCVTAGDIRAYKLEDLKKRSRRAGFPNITTKENSALLRKPKHPYDGVLIDAPCSCSGVWRRNPGSQWQLAREELNKIAQEQLDILKDYASAVRPGGVLVYATCSLFDQENQEVVHRFLEEYGELFKLDPFEHPLTGNIVPGMLRIDGYDFDCDTLFVAKMRRVK